jgi:hypothetical protein
MFVFSYRITVIVCGVMREDSSQEIVEGTLEDRDANFRKDGRTSSHDGQERE